jgi:type IV pilus assembly protein PilQ
MKMIPFIDSLNNAYRVLRVVASCLILGVSQSWLFSNSALANNGVNRLEQISHSTTMPGNRVQIQFNFANTNITQNNFSLDNPARIVLDFPNTKLGLRKRSQPIGIGVVQGTSAVEAADRSRIVIKLVRMVPFNISQDGKRVLVTVEQRASQTTTPQTSAPLSAPSMSSTPTVSGPPRYTMQGQPRPTVRLQGADIQDIDFRRTSDGAGRIAITLSNPSISVDMRQEGTDIVLEFTNTRLPRKLDRRLDVLDFATPISFIDTFPAGPNVRINITVRGNYEHHAYQTGNLYVVEVKEKVQLKQETLKIEERKYEGKLVSFNFQNIDVRSVLSLLFETSGQNLNMIAGEEVRGSVTLRLKNIPWDQALDIILEARGLGMRKIGNVVLIDLKKNIDARKQRELQAQLQLQKVEPLRTQFIVINYAKAKDIVSLLETKGKHSFLSARGSVSMDERTNTLIIQDTASKITEIQNLITQLDTPVRQVLIESRIVVATSQFSKDLGVKFGHSANQDLGQGNGIVFGGKVGGDTKFSGGTGFTAENTQSGGQGENFIVSLPATVAGTQAAALGLAIGKIGSYLLQLELSAMQVEGNGEVLSSPRVITGNQQEASIIQGTEFAVPGTAGVGATAPPEFKEALLELKVTPQITPDGRVIMELEVKKNDIIDLTQGSISRREVKTQVLVDNGDTVVLGGVYERTKTNKMERVPFFADLPLIGHLFKRRSNRDEKSELLIFVTPKILKEAT